MKKQASKKTTINQSKKSQSRFVGYREFHNFKTEIVKRVIWLQQIQEDFEKDFENVQHEVLDKIKRLEQRQIVERMIKADKPVIKASLPDQGLIEQIQEDFENVQHVRIEKLEASLADAKNVANEYRYQLMHDEDRIHSLEDEIQALSACLLNKIAIDMRDGDYAI